MENVDRRPNPQDDAGRGFRDLGVVETMGISRLNRRQIEELARRISAGEIADLIVELDGLLPGDRVLVLQLAREMLMEDTVRQRTALAQWEDILTRVTEAENHIEARGFGR